MIVRNESATLRACLESVQGVADEMIVIDTGSTDGTQAIAAAAGARLIESPWPGDFSVARNLSLQAATGEWILVLDADETLTAAGRAEIARLVAPPATAAYRLVQVGRDFAGSQLRMEIVRLFPNRSSIRFEFPIHEQVDPSLAREKIPVRSSGIEILHSGYDSAENAARKRLQYRAIIEESLARSPAPALELHLRYLSAINHLEDKRWLLAAEEFERCIAQAPSSTMNLVRFARLRVAECYLLAGQPARALPYLPTAPNPSEHPASLYFRAQVEVALGRPAQARPWFESILHVKDGVFHPPVNLAALRSIATGALAASTGA